MESNTHRSLKVNSFSSQPMNANVGQRIAEKTKIFFVSEGFTESMLLKYG
jgi:hypothetical protein